MFVSPLESAVAVPGVRSRQLLGKEVMVQLCPALPTSDWIWLQGAMRALDLANPAGACPSSAPEPPRENTLEPASFKHRKA